MKIEFWYIGKTTESWVSTGMNFYFKKLKPYCTFNERCLPTAAKKRIQNTVEYKQFEEKSILKNLNPQDNLYLLDEKGKKFNSPEFAQWLTKSRDTYQGSHIFLVGGAYGFTDEVYNRATDKIQLSSMTFPHQLVRIIFLEQLYRAFTIINNRSYHH